ncbi:MAG: YlmH/Sll1252 family protein [Oscillospiraceae bacterium]|jgi:RNA-binding protein YlmH|nr:YlmH/Sll1252 family protein [Oscillospiraceae bacterium]
MQPDGEEELRARLRDAIRLVQKDSSTHFVGFLDEHQAAVAAQEAEKLYFSGSLLWGGFPEAERVCFGAFPEWMEPDGSAFPIQAVTASFRECDYLTHRDFLGALTGAGVRREVLGDILLEPGRCIFYVRSEMTDFLMQQVTKIGRVGVKLSIGAKEPLPPAHQYEPFSAVVAAARIDCVAAACVGLSREKARKLLAEGCIQIDHQPVTDADTAVRNGALLSVRGKGRYRIDSLSQPTKKGRLRLEGRKFI